MTNSIHCLSLRTFTANLLLGACLLIAFSGCKKEETAIHADFIGNFTTNNAAVLCIESAGEAVFTSVSVSNHKVGDPFIKITQRTGANTWHGHVYDADLVNFQDGDIKVENDKLLIYPSNAAAYGLSKVIIPGSGSSGGGSGTGGGTTSGGSGCNSVRCSGYTAKNKRCSRMTTNCSGRCYQH